MEDSQGLVFKGLEEFQAKLESMKDRGTIGLRAFLNTTVYTQIQNAQMQRWVSEGASEGAGWDRINPLYAERKLKRFKDYPGQGSKLMIATSSLISSVIGPVKDKSAFGIVGTTDHHRKIVGETSIFVGTDLDYATFVNEKRNFTKLSPATLATIYAGIKRFLAKGVKA